MGHAPDSLTFLPRSAAADRNDVNARIIRGDGVGASSQLRQLPLPDRRAKNETPASIPWDAAGAVTDSAANAASWSARQVAQAFSEFLID